MRPLTFVQPSMLQPTVQRSDRRRRAHRRDRNRAGGGHPLPGGPGHRLGALRGAPALGFAARILCCHWLRPVKARFARSLLLGWRWSGPTTQPAARAGSRSVRQILPRERLTAAPKNLEIPWHPWDPNGALTPEERLNGLEASASLPLRRCGQRRCSFHASEGVR